MNVAFSQSKKNLTRARDIVSTSSQISSESTEQLVQRNNVRDHVVRWHFGKKLEKFFFFAGVDIEQQNKTITRLMFVVFLSVPLSILLNPLFVALAPLTFVIEFVVLNKRIKSRSADFEKDYPALLLSLASGVRTGLDPIVALAQSHELFDSKGAMSQELRNFGNSIDRGINETRALREFADSIPNSDVELFRSAMVLARKEGASLAECLQRLAKVTRQRQSFRRKIKAAVAMQKVSANGIALATLFIALMQFRHNGQAVRAAWENPNGAKLIGFGILMIFIGLVWMRQMASKKLV